MKSTRLWTTYARKLVFVTINKGGIMNKKLISIFTLLAFIVFSISCSITRIKEVRTASDWKGKKGEILSLFKTSGEYIEFSKDNPGRIYGDNIIGTAIIMSKKVVIDGANIKKIRKHQDGTIFEIINKEGKIYHVVGTVRREEGKFICFIPYETFESVTIPLSEVKSVKVKNFNLFVSLLVVVGGVIGLYFLAFAISGGLSFNIVM